MSIRSEEMAVNSEEKKSSEVLDRDTALLSEDPSCSTGSSRGASKAGGRPRRHVQLVDVNPERDVHETPPLSDEEFNAYFTQPEDSKRFDTDVKNTIQQWVDYKTKRIAHFDDEQLTLRGLEEVLDHMKCNNTRCRDQKKTSRSELKTNHIQNVLQEVNRQKRRASTVSGTGAGGEGPSSSLDAEQLRSVSLGLSEDARKEALRIAEKDEMAVRALDDDDDDVIDNDSNNDNDSSSYQNINKKEERRNRNVAGSIFRRRSDPVNMEKITTHAGASSAADEKKRRKSMFSFISRSIKK